MECRSTLFRGYAVLRSRLRSSANAYSVFHKQKPVNIVLVSGTNNSQEKWPNSKLGPIDAINPKYPLPGSVGVPVTKRTIGNNMKEYIPATQTLPPLREENYASVLMEVYNNSELEASQSPIVPQISDELECTIHTCPTLVQKDLDSLFPDKKLGSSPLTAIVLSHHTTEGLDMWSEEAICEREQLAESFISSAIDICSTLKELGYWTDFIDPFTGKPYLGTSGEMTLTENSEQMIHFGFELDNSICCKILRHARWKHNVFAGLIFTDAPRDHPVLLHI